MLIGIDASRAATERRTGTEAYALYLLQGLIPRARAAGHQVRLYFNLPPGSPTPLDDVADDVRCLPARRLWTHWRLAIELRREPPDLFFTPSHVIPVTYRGPSVATVHDLGYHYYPRAHTRRQRYYLVWSTRHNATRGRRIIADSEATLRDLGRFYGTPAEKIDVVYPGPTPTLAPVEDEARLRAVWAKYGITPPYFLFLGTLQPRKNVTRLLAAYWRLRRQSGGNSPRLVLAGGWGWEMERVRDALDALPDDVRSTVIIPGFVAEEDKAALLSGAVALTFPSLYEGFGFPVLEAQQCDTPVLTSTASSLPEIGGDAALYVDPEDERALLEGLRRLGEDEALREELRRKGRLNVRRFSWEKAAEQALQTLERAYDA